MLTPPTQPEVQAFRKWICRQVLSQAAGARPEPWQVPDDAVGAMDLPEGWDPAVVTEAARGLIAADATSRILAVSAEAAAILGYDDPVELVGKRIVSIVPERYRQAHVAGFTMYLLVGRKPLLDRRVQVPALRRDGTEVEVELTVRSPADRHRPVACCWPTSVAPRVDPAGYRRVGGRRDREVGVLRRTPLLVLAAAASALLTGCRRPGRPSSRGRPEQPGHARARRTARRGATGPRTGRWTGSSGRCTRGWRPRSPARASR